MAPAIAGATLAPQKKIFAATCRMRMLFAVAVIRVSVDVLLNELPPALGTAAPPTPDG